jgi:hypothetical protein
MRYLLRYIGPFANKSTEQVIAGRGFQTKAYQNRYDVLYRREATAPNEIWQADHTPLDIRILDDAGKPARPWLTVILDDYSRGLPASG